MAEYAVDGVLAHQTHCVAANVLTRILTVVQHSGLEHLRGPFLSTSLVLHSSQVQQQLPLVCALLSVWPDTFPSLYERWQMVIN